MSTEQDKFKNSRRRLKDENAIKKQVKIAKQHHLDNYDASIDRDSRREPHRFAKHHAMDCGNPRCSLCGNPRKTHKNKLTPQEKRLFQDIDRVRDRHSNGTSDQEQ